MNPEDVGRILDEIGERIGPAGEYAWAITVRQVYVEAVVWGILALAVAIGMIVALAAIWRMHATAVRRWENPEERHGFSSYRPDADGYAFASAAPVIVLVLSAIALASSVTKLLNPEYHAMIRLLERLVP